MGRGGKVEKWVEEERWREMEERNGGEKWREREKGKVGQGRRGRWGDWKDANGTVRELVFPKGLDLDRPKRARTTFSGDQLSALEREFRRNQYLVGRERSLLAARLGLSETQVKVWYQNRRTKHKRDREREHEAPTPTAAPLTQRPTLLAPPNPVPTTTPNNNNHNAPLYTLPTPSMHPHHHHHHPLPLPPKLCTPTAPHPPTTSPLTSFPGSQEVLLGRQAPEGTEPQGNQGGSCSSPSTGAPKDPSPPRHNSPRGGVEYQMGVGVGGVEYQMGGVKFDHLESTFSKTLPTLLGSFHSVPPSFPPSAFRPLLPRPLHPLALQHHALGRPHPTWLP
ncbi:hypothetical protein Pmani_017571 [Petrolisthes manimaculis]|uniref:Homeobox domain-containing protein n=1 Tax=Petrolisthes manimaculis TaxID=1843537 RepID=A0AAE1PM21_9EUCA|nr:hypothetical protein Pmani_017571 [Petrolisthes manimaculis]